MFAKFHQSYFILGLFFMVSCSGVNKYGRDLSFSQSYVQKTKKGVTSKKKYSQIANGSMKAYNLMFMSRGLGALLAQYEVTDSIKYLEEAYQLTLSVVNRAQKSKDIKGNRSPFMDNYLSWINLNPNYAEHPNGGGHLQEVPLFESYFFRYMARMLYLTNKIPSNKSTSLIASNYKPLLNFITVNGWEKWYERGLKHGKCYKYLFRSRTHMTSHWAMVALYLAKIDNNSIKISQYTTFKELYDKQLRDNLKIQGNQAYIWNMTWDSPWPYGTDCHKATKPKVQDGSHGNHVVTYVIECYQLREGWYREDIDRLVNTAKFILYNKTNNLFYGDLNQTPMKRFENGMEYADGFLKLARYDKTLLKYFEMARRNNATTSSFEHNEIQYVAEFKLAQKYLSN